MYFKFGESKLLVLVVMFAAKASFTWLDTFTGTAAFAISVTEELLF
jgi:hypothetical protein